MADRTVSFKVLADSAQFDAAMLKAGASTQTLAKSMNKAVRESEELQKATNAARAATLEQAAAEKVAAAATEKSAAAAKKAAKAQVEAGAAAENYAEAQAKLARGDISAAEAEKLKATAARKDRDAEISAAAADRAAAAAAEKLERAAIKASVAQLAQAKAAKAAGEYAGARGLSKKQGQSLLSGLIGDGSIVGEQAGKAFMQGFSSAAEEGASGITKILASASMTAGDLLLPALVGAALGAAPFVLAAVGGAVLAGVGGAGIGLGIAGQIKSPAVKAAWTYLGKFGKEKLTEISSGFEKPLVRAANIFGHQLDLSSGDLKKLVDGLAPEVDSLAQGIASTFGNIVSHLPAVVSAVKPILNVLANDLPRVGDDIGEFMEIISEDSQGAADGLIVLMALFSGLLKVAGYTIAGAEVIVHNFFNTLGSLLVLVSKIPGAPQSVKNLAAGFLDVTDTSHKAANGVDDFGTHTQTSAEKTKALNKALDDLVSQLSGLASAGGELAQAEVGADQAVDSLTESIKKNGDAFSGNSAKAHENEAALGAAEKAAADAADAKYKETGSISAANAEYERYIAKLRATLKAAGKTDEQIDALIDTYATVPQYIQTLIKDPGAVSSTTNVKDLRAAQKTLERLIKVAVQTHAPTKDVDRLKKRLEQLHNRELWITIHQQVVGHTSSGATQYRTDSGGKVLIQANGGIVESYAGGGMRESHVAQIAPPGSYRLFGERETGGEAYLPLSPAKRSRSTQVLTAVAGQFGVPIGRAAMQPAAAVAGSAPTAEAIGQAAAAAMSKQLAPVLGDVAAAVMADKVFRVGQTEFARAVASSTKSRGRALQGSTT